MHVLVDADILVYRAGFAAETTEYEVCWFDPEFDEECSRWCESAAAANLLMEELKKDLMIDLVRTKRVTPEPVRNAMYNVRSMIDTTVADLQANPEDVTAFLSGKTNFREEIATIRKYKGNRDNMPKPVHAPALREYINGGGWWKCVVSDNEEADDMLGYYQMQYLSEGEDSVICTLDKDLMMIPGLHYDFVKRETFYVDPDEADVYFWRQLLTGDATDNIPGLAKVGPKKAEKVFPFDDPRSDREKYEVALSMYQEKYDDPEAALLENARLLWIRREPEEMWCPPRET